MSKVTNRIRICCDRCFRSECYESQLQIENVGWGCDIEIDNSTPMDLCPKCYSKLGDLIHGYLYRYNPELKE